MFVKFKGFTKKEMKFYFKIRRKFKAEDTELHSID